VVGQSVYDYVSVGVWVMATYRDFTGTSACAVTVPDIHVGRYANFAGTLAVVTTVPDIHLSRLANFTGTSMLVVTILDINLRNAATSYKLYYIMKK